MQRSTISLPELIWRRNDARDPEVTRRSERGHPRQGRVPPGLLRHDLAPPEGDGEVLRRRELRDHRRAVQHDVVHLGYRDGDDPKLAPYSNIHFDQMWQDWGPSAGSIHSLRQGRLRSAIRVMA